MLQPIRVLPASAEVAAEAAHRDRDLRRLLAIWRQLAGRYVSAQAHATLHDELELCDALNGIEGALRTRHRSAWRRLQARLQQLLLELDHVDPATPATACIVCRRLTDGIPVSVAQLAEEAGR